MEIITHRTKLRGLQKFLLLSLLAIVSATCQSNETKSQTHVPETHAPENQAQTRYGPIMLGDTLSNIAYTLFPDGSLTREQIMWALYQNNPDAFIDNDINNIKQGVTLNIPGYNKINSTPHLSAKQNLEEHTNLSHKEVKILKDKLKSARDDAESQQHERELLKAQLIEMEKQIQQLIEQNRIKDMELQSLDKQIKQ